MYSPEDTARIEYLRHKASHEGLTAEEQREVVAILREGRKAAAVAVTKSKAAKAKPSGEAVLAGLMALMKKPGDAL